jgi:hypothetical protein
MPVKIRNFVLNRIIELKQREEDQIKSASGKKGKSGRNLTTYPEIKREVPKK